MRFSKRVGIQLTSQHPLISLTISALAHGQQKRGSLLPKMKYAYKNVELS